MDNTTDSRAVTAAIKNPAAMMPMAPLPIADHPAKRYEEVGVEIGAGDGDAADVILKTTVPGTAC